LKRIVILDEGDFSFFDEQSKPLGGAQSAFIGLVKGLTSIGCKVQVRNLCEEEYSDDLLEWRKLDYLEILDADLYIVNRSTRLFSMIPRNRKTLFWLHNRGNYLLKPKNFKFLLSKYPTLVFSGKYHRSTFLLWPLFKNRIIPYGLNDLFFERKSEMTPPAPRAIFTSNPLRSLDWLVDRWVEIRRKVPEAELHIFSGPSPYGSWGESVAKKMNQLLQYAKDHKSAGIVVHDPVSKEKLREEIQKSRLMLYKGDIAETFCLSIAESLELGVPCVTMDYGSMKERIQDGVTGFVLERDEDFVEKAVDLLSNDNKWKPLHQNLITAPVNLSWKHVANQFRDS
jgi:glycosyltransferase involved in cell wall biosynthesis